MSEIQETYYTQSPENVAQKVVQNPKAREAIHNQDITTIYEIIRKALNLSAGTKPDEMFFQFPRGTKSPTINEVYKILQKPPVTQKDIDYWRTHFASASGELTQGEVFEHIRNIKQSGQWPLGIASDWIAIDAPSHESH